MGLHLVLRWLHVLGLTLLSLLAFTVRGATGDLVVAAIPLASLAFTVAFLVLVERGIAGFRPLRPQLSSIYDPSFWRVERLWKVPDTYLMVLNGTPFKPLVLRLLGARVGRRVFDDGCYLTERTLTSIGDDCTLNLNSRVQCHSQEDGTFKSDRSSLGAGCTLGVGALVHYGVSMGHRAVLAADSFLMKGEEVPAGADWGGNPAIDRSLAAARRQAAWVG
jgi:non-ribosomal peptide synthetase-like protein